MKKRDMFWIKRLLSFIIVMLIFALLSLYNIVQFNNSYMQEEKEEITIFSKQIEWAITPYLKNNDIKTIQKYCDDFRNKEIAFGIFNSDKKLLAKSETYSVEDNFKNENIPHEKYSKWREYIHSIKNKVIRTNKELNIDNSKYYIELVISQEDVIKSIVEAQKNIIVFALMCGIFLIIALIQLFGGMRKSFNRLEDSVIEIANGKLDTPVIVPQNGLLEELALSIKVLVQRLKTQITRLAQLEQYKSDFIQNISHEIKTPITAINSAVELLETTGTMNDKDRECFEIIQFQTKSINKLVNDILALSEIEVEKTNEEKSFRNFNLNKMVTDTINYLGYTNVNFMPGDDVEIFGNEELLTTALSNLIINAVKYSSSDKIDIFLNKKDSKIELSVVDYGVGIKKEHLNKIFERFYRVDKARSRETGGTGLGLAIVKNIVELHKGIIFVKSEVNKKTAFIIEIPVSLQEKQ